MKFKIVTIVDSLKRRLGVNVESDAAKARVFRLSIIAPFLLLISAVVANSHNLQYSRVTLALVCLAYASINFAGLRVSFFRCSRIWPGFELFVDLLVVTWVIVLTGGPVSPCLFLYLPIVMEGAILYSRPIALGSAIVATLLYSSVANLMLTGIIKAVEPSVQVAAPRGGLLVQSLGLISGMALVAILASFLVKTLQKSQAAVAQSKREFSDLIQRQEGLFNELPEGVITTDSHWIITSVNEAAEQILNLEGDKRGHSLRELFKDLNLEFDGPDGKLSNQREIKLYKPNTKEPEHVIYRCRPLLNSDGSRKGAVIVFQDVSRLRAVEEQLKMQERMSRVLAQQNSNVLPFPGASERFIGETPIMKQVYKLIERVATTEATVLVMGESGTGKELVARSVHGASRRRQASFVAVNCSAIPENLIESELFGHKKGSFTGADSDYPGLFLEADKGTIFLDEIAELPLALQSKLLRVLQERKVRAVGSSGDVDVDVRIISATNRDLKAEVAAGRFREDLYYRLNVVSFQLPALRERRDDIPLLIAGILRKLLGKTEEAIVSPQAMQLLLRYDYPGNVRELENILERALVLGGTIILPDHLPDHVQNYLPSTRSNKETKIIVLDDVDLPVKLDELLNGIERAYLEAALSQSGGVKKRAAQLLGLNFRSMRYRLQKFDL